MLINWFTVVAQIFNFLVLIFLLKRFLYKPIIRSIEQRQKRIAARMNEAEEAKNQALIRSRELDSEKAAIKGAKTRYLSEARQKVDQWHKTALEKARREVEDQRQDWIDSLELEKQRFSQQLKIRVAREVMRITGKVVSDLAGQELEAQVVEKFLILLRAEHIDEIKKRLQVADQIQVRSGFELSDSLKTRITQTMSSLFPAAGTVQFAVQSALGFGIRLIAGDWKLDWNMAEYLKDLETEIIQSLTPAGRGRS